LVLNTDGSESTVDEGSGQFKDAPVTLIYEKR